MTKHLSSIGYTVSGFDERKGDTPSVLGESDLVIVTVPIQVTAETIKKTVKHIKPGACLMEIASLKSGIHDAILEASESGIDVLCVHPMWGPSTCNLKDKTVAVIPVVEVELEKQKTLELFPSATIEVVDAEEHDRLMSLLLTLPYLVNITIAETIMDEDLELLKRLSGTSFALQYTLAQSIVTEKTELIEALIAYNPYKNAVYDKFNENLHKVFGSVGSPEFRKLHESVKESMKRDPQIEDANTLRSSLFDEIQASWGR